MALQSKTFSWGSYSWGSESNAYVVELRLQELSVREDTNTSLVEFELVLKSGSQNRFTGDVDAAIGLNGVTVASGTKHISAAYNDQWTLLSGTVDVAHSEDGTLSMPITVDIRTYNRYAPPTTSLSWEWELTSIPRCSGFGAVSGAVLGDTMQVDILPCREGVTHMVYYRLGENQWSGGHPGVDRVEVPLPLSLAALSGEGEFSLLLLLRTFLEGSQLGADVARYVTVTVPDNAQTQPRVTLTAEPVDSPAEGLFVQGKTRLQVRAAAEDPWGASITGLTLQIGDAVYNAYEVLTEVLSEAKDISIVATAQNSRGFTTRQEVTVTVLPYARPMIQSAAARRCTREGADSDSGTYLRLWGSRVYSPVQWQGQNHNFCEMLYCFKTEGQEDFSPWQVLLPGDAEGDSMTSAPLLEGALDVTRTYVVRLGVRDSFSEEVAYTTLTVPCEQVYSHRPAGGRGMGLGGYCEGLDLLDVHWDQRIRGHLQVDGGAVIGGEGLAAHVTETGKTGIWTYRKWSDGTAQCWGTDTREAVAVDTPWGALYESGGYRLDLPEGLFAETPQFQVTLIADSGVIPELYAPGSPTQTPSICAVKPAPMTLGLLQTAVTARGKWKLS